MQRFFQLENPVNFSSQAWDDQHVTKWTVSNTPLQTVTGLVTKRNSNLLIDNENFSTRKPRGRARKVTVKHSWDENTSSWSFSTYKLRDLRFWIFWCQKQDDKPTLLSLDTTNFHEFDCCWGRCSDRDWLGKYSMYRSYIDLFSAARPSGSAHSCLWIIVMSWKTGSRLIAKRTLSVKHLNRLKY